MGRGNSRSDRSAILRWSPGLGEARGNPHRDSGNLRVSIHSCSRPSLSIASCSRRSESISTAAQFHTRLYDTVHLPDPAGFRPGDPVAQDAHQSNHPQARSIFCLTIARRPVQLSTATSVGVGPAEYLCLSPPPLSSCACCRLRPWYLCCMSLLALLVPGVPAAPPSR